MYMNDYVQEVGNEQQSCSNDSWNYQRYFLCPWPVHGMEPDGFRYYHRSCWHHRAYEPYTS